MPGATRDPALQSGSWLLEAKSLGPRWLVLGAIAAAILLATVQLVRGPSFVSRVTTVNPTAYNLQVDVSSGARQGGTPVSDSAPTAMTTTNEVVDQGSVWVFRFQYLGQTGGEVVITRAELARGGWRVTVPDDVARNLQSHGLWPPPPRT